MSFWGRTLQLSLLFVLASFAASEVFAWTRGFHPWLGRPLTHLGVWPLYHPWEFWRWLWAWGWQSPAAFRSAGIVFGVVFGGLLGAMLWPKPTGKPQAQWATRRSL
jgi:hypothetical protein